MVSKSELQASDLFINLVHTTTHTTTLNFHWAAKKLTHNFRMYVVVFIAGRRDTTRFTLLYGVCAENLILTPTGS